LVVDSGGLKERVLDGGRDPEWEEAIVRGKGVLDARFGGADLSGVLVLFYQDNFDVKN